MNFTTLATELSDRVKAYDNSIATDLVILKRWINLALDAISSEANWDFLKTYDIIQTVTDYTTGTASVAAGGTTVTFSAAITASKANQYIQFSTSDDWYEITAHTAGTDTATIDPAYVGTDALSAGTYTIRKLIYTPASTITSISGIFRLEESGKLESLSTRSFEFLLPLQDSTGTPIYYNKTFPSSSGTPQFTLYPAPDAVINLYVTGLKDLSDLSSDSDTPVLPKRFHYIILDKACAMAFASLDDNRSREYESLYRTGIQLMKNYFDTDLGRHRVMKSIDDHITGPEFTLPAQFGPMS